jgi:hypothetical protein
MAEWQAARRLWLEQQRRGLSSSDGAPVYGSARVGVARAPAVRAGTPTVRAGALDTGDPVVRGGRTGEARGNAPPLSSVVQPGRRAADGFTPPLHCVTSSRSPFDVGPWAAAGQGATRTRCVGSADAPPPAYPAYGRMYDRFHPDERIPLALDPLARAGYGGLGPLGGVQEWSYGYGYGYGGNGYGGGYGYGAGYGNGGYGSGGYGNGGYGSGGYGYGGGYVAAGPDGGVDCARVTIVTATGPSYTVPVALYGLGLGDARDLDLAIDARLSRGMDVVLPGIDGRVLRIAAGTPIEDIRIAGC